MTTGIWQLVRLQWRTTRGLLLVAPVLLAGLVCAVAGGIAKLYPAAEQRAVYRETMGASPAAAAFNGRGHDLDTLGGIAAYEVGFMGQLAIPLIGLLMAVRLTRRLEDSGILELVTSGRIARTAVPLAAALSCALAWLLFGGLGVAGLAAQDFPLTGSARYLLVLGLSGIGFSALGLVLAQVASSSRTATSVGLVAILVFFLGRAVVDGLDLRLTWLSPLGWVAEAHPWGRWQWWPVIAFVVKSLAGVGLATLVCARRDLGSGLFPQRLGRATARAGLASPWGLAWRLCGGGLLGWLLGTLVWSGAIGAMSQEFVDAVQANPSLAQAFGGDARHLSTVMGLLCCSLMATSAGLNAVLRLGTEEASARTGLLAAGRPPRSRWWLAFTGLGLAATAVALLGSSVALGLVQWQVMDSRASLDDATRAGMELLAPCLALVALGALLVAVVPRWRAAVWLPVAWALVVGLLGEPLRLPEWARDLSPLHWVGQLPVESANATAIWTLAVGCLLGLGVGLAGYQRRDLLRG